MTNTSWLAKPWGWEDVSGKDPGTCKDPEVQDEEPSLCRLGSEERQGELGPRPTGACEPPHLCHHPVGPRSPLYSPWALAGVLQGGAGAAEAPAAWVPEPAQLPSCPDPHPGPQHVPHALSAQCSPSLSPWPLPRRLRAGPRHGSIRAPAQGSGRLQRKESSGTRARLDLP